ncbi:meiosis protein SPO22/ZIP4 like domain-containing protein [Hirsutella rhossiliensis]|uniref:Meiosis protein SPO22/ZIP4 like domain-containing protein n=1 Tax=Hirsutella rhossiliensis TaxID=111463 RepID=A0A9P8N3R9_9HYPO|nr:meiosis protein SPO22/ZIP4 like domain-containing protein [Hirsutella rhossiliensis]KAH0966392.1 meiosis protein SPO22/ZIP4 like domain-containing protein [Hirsutella rhossiliensis]
MASADPIVVVGREKAIRSIIGFAVHLEAELPASRDGGAVDVLIADLSQHLQAIENLSQQQIPPGGMAKDLERQGRGLWNLCIRVKRDKTNDAAPPRDRARLLVSARVFAYHMLALGRLARGHRRHEEADVVYLLNLALTLARICLGESELRFAKLALQKAADYVERLKPLVGADGPLDLSGARQRLQADYLTLRVALDESWKEDRLDVAEHMYGKTHALRKSLPVSSAEAMADTLQHIGADSSSKGNHTLALQWLKRAHDLINGQSLEQLSAYGLELRLAICHGRVQSLLALGSTESLQEASNLVAYVESEIGDKPVVLHWRLEILQKSPGEVFDAEACTSILRRMIRCFDHSDETFRFLLHQIKELKDRSERLACGLLDEFTKLHVLPSANVTWINEVVVKRIWMATTQTDEEASLKTLHGLMENAHDGLSGPLKPDAAGAVHSLVWKKAEALFGTQQFATADAWCELALHQLFASGGEANAGKIGRKRILCALRLNDAERAKDAYHSMPKGPQEDALTGYLMFKVSLLSWDHELGCQSIAHLSKVSDTARGRDILYACVREAQQFGDKLCTLAALKAVADSWAVGGLVSDSLPAILRCTIRLMHMTEEEEDAREALTEKPDFTEDICEVFSKAAEHAKQHPKDDQGHRVFTVPELHWFRKNAYNVGATNCHTWPLPHTIRVFSACLSFIDCYPKDIPQADAAELGLMGMRCHFVIGAALISLARAEDRMDEQLQRYLEARHHITAFDDLMQAGVGTSDEAVAKDVAGKMATLSVFDFESAVCLKGWDDLSHIVRKAKPCKDEAMYKAMGDCLLRSRAPGKVMYATMRLIINEIYELQDFDGEKLAKYIRCMVQAMLPLDDALALQLIDQALQIAREGHQVGRPFPGAELEWLVATAFNHAVDFYARAEEQPCHRWALKAMALAEYADDGGSLAVLLRDRFARLRFEQGSAAGRTG